MESKSSKVLPVPSAIQNLSVKLNSIDSSTVFVGLGLGIVLLFCLVILLLIRRVRNHKRLAPMTKDRVFFRESLDSTEYMKMLASVDRKLVMEEILEKRRQALTIPEIAYDDVRYIDEVFVDIRELTSENRENECSKIIYR
ncbi:uncharacterized protein LOC111086009 [Limulus polyphemus]|uniref:Uncharacterized protein LOC111086009 n=1 Tax=Limulus polyphemus TaxID=6850 RepID=A0ABM1SH14_LIMPO|nr:uncharacterized protein LOC111086009 [Limulus polyphemus]